jgi:hypothetical protein
VKAKDYVDCETSREPEDVCAICRFDFDDANPCFKLHQGRHQYHEECIEEWMDSIKCQGKVWCPFCMDIICEGSSIPEFHFTTYEEGLATTPPWANPEWWVTKAVPYKLELQGRRNAFFEQYDSLEWKQSNSESGSDSDDEAQAGFDPTTQSLARLSLGYGEE